MSSLINWWKPLEFGVQNGDYANNGGYDDSDCNNGKFMENDHQPDDQNERSDARGGFF